MKKILLFLLVLMFIPTTTFALSRKTLETKKKGNLRGTDCDQYIKFYYDVPVVGEEPAKTVKIVYKSADGEKTINAKIYWEEYDVSPYEAYWNNQPLIPNETTVETFKEGKYYYWDFNEDAMNEEETTEFDEFDDANFTCEYQYYENDLIYADETQVDSIIYDLTSYPAPIEKNNTIVIRDASYIDSNADLASLYTSPDELIHGTINGLSVSFNLKFNKLNDSYTYLVTLQNGSNEDVEIQVGELAKKSDYVDYKFEFIDGNNIAKAYSNKFLFVTATYKNEVPDALLENGYTENNEIELKVGSDALPDEKENNPKTGISMAIVVIGISAAVVIAIVRMGLKKKVKYLVIVLASMMVFVPYTVNAIKSVTLKVITNVEITYEMTTITINDEEFQVKKGMTLEEWISSAYNINHYVACTPCEDVTEDLVGKQALCPVPEKVLTARASSDAMDGNAYEVVTLDVCQDLVE